jgi:hypothetical protein
LITAHDADSTIIRRIEFELEKAEHGMAFALWPRAREDAGRRAQAEALGRAGETKAREMTSTLTNIAVAVAGLAIFVSWFTVISSRGLLMSLVASVAFGGAAALLITAARSLG